MTIKIPEKTIFDKLLRMLGKKRKLLIPENVEKTYEKWGPYVQIKAKKESFIKALFRRSKKKS